MSKFTKWQTRSYGAFKKAAQGSIGAFNKLSSAAKAARHAVNDINSATEMAGTLGTAVSDSRAVLSGLSMAGV